MLKASGVRMTETGTIIFALVVLLGAVAGAAFLTWFERRLLGIWQDRYGPNRLGPFGVYQVLADMIKLLTKHDWVPPFSDLPLENSGRVPSFAQRYFWVGSQTHLAVLARLCSEL